jgi:hypothetical protein
MMREPGIISTGTSLPRRKRCRSRRQANHGEVLVGLAKKQLHRRAYHA